MLRTGVSSRIVAPRAGEGDVSGVGPAGVNQAGISLVESPHTVVEAELRKALHNLLRGELFVGDARRVHRAGVLVYVARVVLDRLEVEAAGLEDESSAGLLLYHSPGFVGMGGEGRVLGGVVGEADDARVVL
jgi:hypothetical protein